MLVTRLSAMQGTSQAGNLDADLAALYHDTKRVGAYRGASSFIKSLQGSTNPYPDRNVRQWLRGREEYTLHRPFTRVRETLSFLSPHPRHTLQADLMDVSSIAGANDGNRFILTTVDVFTGESSATPIASKSGQTVASALQPQLVKGYLFLHTDKGTEFYNRFVRKVVSDLGITHYSTENDNIKAGVVERFNRTLREVMARMMNHRRSKRYMDDLQALVQAHNNTTNSRTQKSPNEMVQSDPHLEWILRHERMTPKTARPQFSVGDHVRLSAARRQFLRGYHEQWTREVFVVKSVDNSTEPITYRVEDLMGEEIKGRFYLGELQKVTYDPDAEFQIEKVIRTRKRGGKTELLVKWQGYPEKFNSWIDNDLV